MYIDTAYGVFIMKRVHPILSSRAIIYGCIAGVACFISRTTLGNPLNMLHMVGSSACLPPLWIFNLLSVIASTAMGISAAWVLDGVASGYNNGAREISAYRGALFVSCAFFLFLIWFPVLFFAQRLFLSFAVSVFALICSLCCAIEWSRVRPSRSAAAMYINTVWLFYIMFVSLSVWWEI